MLAALADPELAKLPDRALDRLFGTSVGFTSRVRKSLTSAKPDPVKSAAATRANALRYPAWEPTDHAQPTRSDAAFRVLGGAEPWGVEHADALDWLRQLPERAASLTLFSPPYEGQRGYDMGFRLKGQAWVDWLRPIVTEAARVTAGLVLVTVSGPVRDHEYSPVVEWLAADLTRRDGLACGPSPYAWVKPNAMPGSGSENYHRRAWEPIYAFCLPDRLPLAWSDPLAFGEAPVKGTKRGQRMTRRKSSGARPLDSKYTAPAIANPGNVLSCKVGGGNLGHPLAHENEAPMPLSLAERFVRWYCPPSGIVCDPFIGSGTTAHAAILHGRRFVGCDIRASQVELARRRLGDFSADRPQP